MNKNMHFVLGIAFFLALNATLLIFSAKNKYATKREGRSENMVVPCAGYCAGYMNTLQLF